MSFQLNKGVWLIDSSFFFTTFFKILIILSKEVDDTFPAQHLHLRAPGAMLATIRLQAVEGMFIKIKNLTDYM